MRTCRGRGRGRCVGRLSRSAGARWGLELRRAGRDRPTVVDAAAGPMVARCSVLRAPCRVPRAACRVLRTADCGPIGDVPGVIVHRAAGEASAPSTSRSPINRRRLRSRGAQHQSQAPDVRERRHLAPAPAADDGDPARRAGAQLGYGSAVAAAGPDQGGWGDDRRGPLTGQRPARSAAHRRAVPHGGRCSTTGRGLRCGRGCRRSCTRGTAYQLMRVATCLRRELQAHACVGMGVLHRSTASFHVKRGVHKHRPGGRGRHSDAGE